MKTNKIFKNTLFLLSAIAGFTLTYYYMNEFSLLSNWWSLLALAVISGFFSLITYHLASNHRIANAIISTGLAIVLVSTLLPLFEQFEFINYFPSHEFFEFIVMAVTFLAIAFPTEGCVNNQFHKGDLVLDPLVSAIVSFVITWLKKPLITPGIIFVGFIIIIFINISLKGNVINYNNDGNGDDGNGDDDNRDDNTGDDDIDD